ncbi:MAG: hypothetical protein AAF799_30595 [Myxococcota bacterium]
MHPRVRIVLLAAFAALSVAVLPSAWHARDADRLWSDDAQLQGALARGIDHRRHTELSPQDFLTGHARFDGEWLFGTYMMAGLGYAQTMPATSPERTEQLAAIEDCIEHVLSPAARGFDRAAWGSDPIDDLGSDRGHAAYLGYLNLLLSVHRHLDPDSRYAELNDRISAHLEQRLAQSPIGLVQTYPGETYPVDNTAIFGALAMHQRVSGIDHGAALRTAAQTFARTRDERGLLIQKVDSDSGHTVDGPRGSGTALATYFTSFWSEEHSRSLYDAMHENLRREVLGFGAIREYPPGVDGRGDIDSGAVVFGVSVSASGFALAGARIHHDQETFTDLLATATLFGAPVDRDGRRNFALGGPLGDALMFALLTAHPSSHWSAR